MNQKRIYTVPAVSRALDVLEFLNEAQEASFTEIYVGTRIPKSSAFQLLSTLQARGYVRQGGETRKFSLGLKLLELGTRAVSNLDIRTEAMPVLRDLVVGTNETCHLGILDGTEGVYLAKVEGRQAMRLNSWEGKRLPLHSTAMGKVLLAWQDEARLEELLQSIRLVRFTRNTITDCRALLEHLKKVRDRGWALDDEENEPHVRCVGAPIRNMNGGVVGAISISGLAARFDGEYLKTLSEKAKEAARKLSVKFGGK